MPTPPSALQLDELRAQCDRRIRPDYGERPLSMIESRKRKVSLLFAEGMRKRGWLSEEGYAPGSWADPRNENKGRHDE